MCFVQLNKVRYSLTKELVIFAGQYIELRLKSKFTSVQKKTRDFLGNEVRKTLK